MGFYRNNKLLLALICVLGLTQIHCGEKRGFSLDRSGAVKDIDECFALLKKKKHEKAVRCFESYRSARRGSQVAAIADLAIADSYYNEKEFLNAAEMYSLFIETYPFHSKIPYAYMRKGESYLKASPGTIDRDQTMLKSSEKALETVVAYYKNSPFYNEAAELYKTVKIRQAKHEMYVGRYYVRRKEYLAAIPRFKGVITDFTDVGVEDKAFYYLVKSLVKTDQSDLAQGYFDTYQRFFPDRKTQIQRMQRLLK